MLTVLIKQMLEPVFFEQLEKLFQYVVCWAFYPA